MSTLIFRLLPAAAWTALSINTAFANNLCGPLATKQALVIESWHINTDEVELAGSVDGSESVERYDGPIKDVGLAGITTVVEGGAVRIWPPPDGSLLTGPNTIVNNDQRSGLVLTISDHENGATYFLGTVNPFGEVEWLTLEPVTAFRYLVAVSNLVDDQFAIVGVDFSREDRGNRDLAGIAWVSTESGVLTQTQMSSHGFDDSFGAVRLLSDGTAVALGTTRETHRYDGGARKLWMVHLAQNGEILDERLFAQIPGVVIQGMERFDVGEDGTLSAVWSLQLPDMNDAQLLECTFSVPFTGL